MTSTGSTPQTEQLSLLNTPSVPLQFRLDERTRRTGLQHVAELRAIMAAQAETRRTRVGGRAAQRAADRTNTRTTPRTNVSPQRSAAA